MVPGSIHQLEEEEDRKLNESFKDPRSIQTLCFWFHQFKVNESKINATIDYARVSAENLHCISLPTNESGLVLNFDLKTPFVGGFQNQFKSVKIVLNPKRIVTYELRMDLKSLQSVEELTRFVQVELKNPTAKLVEHRQEVQDSCALIRASYHYPKYYPKFLRPSFEACEKWEETVIIFKSELPFSNETRQFVSDACGTKGWKEKNGIFTVSRHSKVYNTETETPFTLLHPGDDLFISDLHCSIRTNIKVQKFLSFDGGFSLSSKVDLLPDNESH